MSQHNILSNTRKKITYLAVALALAAASPLAVPGLASASDKPDDMPADYKITTDGYDESGYRAFPEKRDVGASSSDYGGTHASYSDSGGDATYEEEPTYHDDYKDSSWGNGDDYSHDEGDYSDSEDYSDYEGQYDDDKDYGHDKDQWDHKKDEPKVVEKTVVHEPVDVNQEVNQEVSQETNVIVEQEQKEVVKAQPVVHEREVVVERQAAVVAATTTKPDTTVIGEGGKGALEETGSQTATSTAAGLGILGALGALHVLRRRKGYASEE